VPTPSDVLDLPARQGGLITCAQATGLGMSARTLRSRLHTDGWTRAAPQVYLAGGHPWTDTTRIRAAGLWAGDRAAVSGPAAAFWHRMLDRGPEQVQLTAGRRTGLRARPGVAVRRRDLAATDLVKVRGLWVTDRPLTALETAIAVERGSEFLDRALQKHVWFPRVYRPYCRNLGAQGFARVAVLLTAAADRADSGSPGTTSPTAPPT
jgi:hypothetical protein